MKSQPTPLFPLPVLAALVAAGMAGCGSPDDDSAPAMTRALSGLEALETPAPPNSGEPNLAAGPDGVYLSWLEQTGESTHALRFARWDGDGWGPTRTVMDREDLFVNWADFPALAVLEDGTLAAHWLQKSGPGTYAYDVRVALSRDGGESWSDDVLPHRDGIQAEHGFVSLLPMDDDVGVVWLDGRETISGNPMTLRFTTVSSSATLGESVLLDASTCDCCQTGMARTADGPVVVYRDRTEGEVRDISVVRRVDGQWTEPRTVHDDGWVIAGCPVNGPSVDARDNALGVAWFTGASLETDAARSDVRQAGERGRVLASFSDDGGATFGPPVRVDDGEAMGRVDVVLLDDSTALVAWLERVDGAAEVRVRRVDRNGVGPAVSVTGTAAERASGFPRMARFGDRVLFAWTAPGESPRVRAAVARLDDAGAETAIATRGGAR